MARPKRAAAARRAEPRPVAASTSRRVKWRAGVLVLAGALAYANSVSAPFIFDDAVTIVDNTHIRDLRPATMLKPERESPVAGRPLVNVSFAVNYALSGLDVRGYHIVNIAIHLLCALLVFGTVRRTLELPLVRGRTGELAVDIGFAVALVWVLHPINSEPVDYLTQRTESMMALFYLLTVYASTRAMSVAGRSPWTVVAVFACACGMASKETMVTAPVTVLLYDRVLVSGSWRGALRDRWRLYGGLSATWAILIALMWTAPRAHSAGFASGVDPWTYLLNQTVLIAHYVRLVLWPRSLVAHYGAPHLVSLLDMWPYALFVAAMLAFTAIGLAWRPELGLAGAWFFVTLAPTSSLIPIATEVGAERRMYLPSAALILLAVLAIRRFTSPRAGAILLACVASALAAATVARNQEYASGLALARTVVERWPGPVADHLLGNELAIAGQHDEAIARLRSAADGGDERARYDLGGELYNAGKFDDAIAQFRSFVRAEPLLKEVVSARTLTGRALIAQRKWPEAAAEFRQVLVMTPSNADVRRLLADSLFSAESCEDAILEYRTYLLARPADGDAYTNLAICLASSNTRDDALAAFRRAAELQPGNAVAHANLGRALALAGKLGDARAEFERALEIDPRNQAAREDLNEVLRNARR